MIKKIVDRLQNKKSPLPIEKQYYDLEEVFFKLYHQCKPYTMLSVERLYANYKAVEYVCKNKIEGSIVECGVWKGGSMMLMIETLKLHHEMRRVYLYDTFAGMPQPDEVDKKASGMRAFEKWHTLQRQGYNEWCYSSLDEVKNNIAMTGYDPDLVHYIEGKVEETIPIVLPEKIAVLRLDTDWYSSTRHELEYLFPLLTTGGVLIIDDYGSWQGARKAVDEFMEKHQVKMLLSRIDNTGRIGIKM